MKRWNRENESVARAEIEKLYIENRERLQTFVKATVYDDELVYDIVQDVFVEALRKYEEFKVHPNQIGWLYLTARYKIKEYLRKWNSRNACESVEQYEDVGNQDDSYCVTELNMAIATVLTAEELLRFRRYFLWGYTLEELARREGITENNMRVRITRLKQKLMKEVK